MKKSSIVLMLLILSLVLSLSAFAEVDASLDNFTKVRSVDESIMADVIPNHWARELLAEAYEYGILNGSGTGIMPQNSLSAAELVAIAARMHAIYFGNPDPEETHASDDGEWYDAYRDYANEYNIMPTALSALLSSSPHSAVTRAVAFQTLYSVVSKDDLLPQNSVYSLPDMSEGSVGYAEILALYKAGVLTGRENGAVAPSDLLSRAEFAAVFMRILDKGTGTRAAGNIFGTAQSSDIEDLLGTPQEIYAHSDAAGVMTHIYHDGNYQNFHMVQYKNDTATAVIQFLDTQTLDFTAEATTKNTYFDSHGNLYYMVINHTSEYTANINDYETLGRLFFHLVNGMRAHYGVTPYRWSNTLYTAAYNHTHYMVENNVFSHYGEDGSSPFDRISALGYNFLAAAENVIISASNPLAYLNNWVGSEGHRHNILSLNYTETGVAFYQGYGTQVFATPF